MHSEAAFAFLSELFLEYLAGVDISFEF